MVPISLCRSGGCGVTTTTSGGVRIDFDDSDVPVGAGAGTFPGNCQSYCLFTCFAELSASWKSTLRDAKSADKLDILFQHEVSGDAVRCRPAKRQNASCSCITAMRLGVGATAVHRSLSVLCNCLVVDCLPVVACLYVASRCQ